MTAAIAAGDNRAFPGPAACKLVGEPTLEDILAGPIVRAMMSADRVDAEALAAMLRSVALRNAQADPPRQARRPSAPVREARVTGWERKDGDRDRD